MRSFRFLMVAVLALIVALPLAPKVYAGQVGFRNLCIPNSPGVQFRFEMTDPSETQTMDFGCDLGGTFSGGPSGTYVFTELVTENPPGWVLTDISCQRISGQGQTSWRIEGASVSINFDGSNDIVACYFTNTACPAVGGVVELANMSALVAPWLAVIGLVGCISTVVVIARKREK